jgi:hypothetical protein
MDVLVAFVYRALDFSRSYSSLLSGKPCGECFFSFLSASSMSQAESVGLWLTPACDAAPLATLNATCLNLVSAIKAPN